MKQIYKVLNLCVIFFSSASTDILAQQHSGSQSAKEDADKAIKAETDNVILLPLPGSVASYGDGLAKSSTVIRDITDETPAIDEALDVEQGGRGADFIVLPIPLSNPSLGTGLALSGVAFYDLGSSSQPSVSALGAFKTSNGSKGGGLYQKVNFSGDKFKFSAALASARLNYDFYGVGNEAGNAGNATPISEYKKSANIDLTMRVTEGVYFGPKYRLVGSKTGIQEDAEAAVIAPLAENDVTVAGLGATLRYDSRDNSLNPANGWLVELEFLNNDPKFGSDVTFDIFMAKLNHYIPLSSNQIIATRLFACSVSDDAPVSELCQLGKGSDIRGYPGGKYRDTNMIAAQAEFRWQFHKKLGVVIFGGLGAVSNNFGNLLDNNILPSGGAGIRYLVSEEYKVNLSLDYAVGKNSQAVYFRVGEAF